MNNGSAREALYLISEDEKEQRIDLFLALREKGLTRSRIQSLIKEECVKVNGLSVKASYKLKPDDRVIIILPAAVPCEIKPEPVDFSLIY